MSVQPNSSRHRVIFTAQLLSVVLMWVFVISISVWIANLITLSLQLNDMPGASVAISVVAIPVFITLAGVLTYVFVGLQKEKHHGYPTSEEK